MNEKELKEILQDNAYIIKQHIALCNEVEKATPLRAYERTIKALNELEPTEEQKENLRLLVSQENINENLIEKEPLTNASALLVEYGLLVDNQVRHKNNLRFIKECNSFINDYGQARFIKVLQQVKAHQDKGGIKNIYGYIKNSLKNELKQGAQYEQRS